MFALANLTDPSASSPPTAFGFASYVPAGSGSLGVALGGTSLACVGYSVGSLRATSVVATLRTTNVYAPSDGDHDRAEVVVAAQLTDARGNTRVELSGMTLTLVVTADLDKSYTTSASCSQDGTVASSGLLTCRATVPTSWFADVTDGSGASAIGRATAALEHKYSGSLVAEQAAGIFRSEQDAALAVAEGSADVCMGLATVARQLRLDFVPLTTEQFDLFDSAPGHTLKRPQLSSASETPVSQVSLNPTRKWLEKRYLTPSPRQLECQND